MAILAAGPLRLQGKYFLDERLDKAQTLDDLRNWDFDNYPLPEGIEIPVETEWYEYMGLGWSPAETEEAVGHFKRRNEKLDKGLENHEGRITVLEEDLADSKEGTEENFRVLTDRVQEDEDKHDRDVASVRAEVPVEVKRQIKEVKDSFWADTKEDLWNPAAWITNPTELRWENHISLETREHKIAVSGLGELHGLGKVYGTYQTFKGTFELRDETLLEVPQGPEEHPRIIDFWGLSTQYGAPGKQYFTVKVTGIDELQINDAVAKVKPAKIKIGGIWKDIIDPENPDIPIIFTVNTGNACYLRFYPPVPGGVITTLGDYDVRIPGGFLKYNSGEEIFLDDKVVTVTLSADAPGPEPQERQPEIFGLKTVIRVPDDTGVDWEKSFVIIKDTHGPVNSLFTITHEDADSVEVLGMSIDDEVEEVEDTEEPTEAPGITILTIPDNSVISGEPNFSLVLVPKSYEGTPKFEILGWPGMIVTVGQTVWFVSDYTHRWEPEYWMKLTTALDIDTNPEPAEASLWSSKKINEVFLRPDRNERITAESWVLEHNAKVGGYLEVTENLDALHISSQTSDIADLPEHIARTVKNVGIINLVRNSGFTGEYDSVMLNLAYPLGKDSQMWSPEYAGPWEGWRTWIVSPGPFGENRYALELKSEGDYAQQTLKDLIIGDSTGYNISFWSKGNLDVYVCGQKFSFSDGPVLTRHLAHIPSPVDETQKVLRFQARNSGGAYVAEPKVEWGIVGTDWFYNPDDPNPVFRWFRQYQPVIDTFQASPSQPGAMETKSVLLDSSGEGGWNPKVNFLGGEVNDDAPEVWTGGTLSKATSAAVMLKNASSGIPEGLGIKSLLTHGGLAYLAKLVAKELIVQDLIVSGEIRKSDGSPISGGSVRKGITGKVPAHTLGYKSINDASVSQVDNPCNTLYYSNGRLIDFTESSTIQDTSKYTMDQLWEMSGLATGFTGCLYLCSGSQTSPFNTGSYGWFKDGLLMAFTNSSNTYTKEQLLAMVKPVYADNGEHGWSFTGHINGKNFTHMTGRSSAPVFRFDTRGYLITITTVSWTTSDNKIDYLWT